VPPEVAQAQQQLDKAAAAVQPTSTAVAQAAAPATVTVVPPTATAVVPTAVPSITPVPAPLLAGQVRYGLQPNDNFAGLTWQDVRTSNTHFVVPSNWALAGIAFDANGISRLVSNSIGVGSALTRRRRCWSMSRGRLRVRFSPSLTARAWCCEPQVVPS